MIKDRIRKIGFVASALRIRDFLRKWCGADLKFSYFALPLVLSTLSSLFEAVSLGFLVPLAKGVIKMDFVFLKDSRILGAFLRGASSVFFLSNIHIFVFLVGAVFASALLKNIFHYFSVISTAYQVRRLSHNIRRQIFERYLSFGKLFFDRASEAHLYNVIFTFTHMVCQKIVEVHAAINCVFTLAAYLALMSFISWKLTLLLLLISPGFYYMLRWLVAKIKRSSAHYSAVHNDLSKNILRAISCMPLVKAYCNEQSEREAFDRLSESVANTEFSIDKKSYIINPMQETVMLSMLLVLVSIIAFMVVKEKQEVAGFLVYFYLMRKAVSAFSGISSFRGNMATVSGHLSEILKIFEDTEKHFVCEGTREFDGLKKSIEFRQLSFSYVPEKKVLEDVSFSINKNEVTAIVGSTGSGKTTIINLFLRFYDHMPEAIFIDGTDIRQFTLRSLRARIALVGQDAFLFNDTLRSNIIYGLAREIDDYEIMEILKKARLYDLVVNFPKGLDTVIGDRGVKLSGGERQRVAIARAFLKNAEILILDEATSSLDTKTEQQIQQAIEEVMKDRTSIVVAHRLSTVKNAHKIVVVENGRVVELGKLDELIEAKNVFYNYWHEQRFR